MRNHSYENEFHLHVHFHAIHTAYNKATHIRSVHINKLSLWFNCRTVRGSCRYGTIGACEEARGFNARFVFPTHPFSFEWHGFARRLVLKLRQQKCIFLFLVSSLRESAVSALLIPGLVSLLFPCNCVNA